MVQAHVHAVQGETQPGRRFAAAVRVRVTASSGRREIADAKIMQGRNKPP